MASVAPAVRTLPAIGSGTGRSFAAIATNDQWLRCAHHNTALDTTAEVVTLAAPRDLGAGTETALPPMPVPLPAGLAFDVNGCLYRGDPERSQVQRVPLQPGDAPVDLLAPPPDTDDDSEDNGGAFAPASPVPGLHLAPIALATDLDDHLFVLDGTTGHVHVLDLADGRLLRTIAVTPTPVDLAPNGRTVLAATTDLAQPLVELDALGVPMIVALDAAVMDELAALPAGTRPRRVAVGPAGEQWLLVGGGAATKAIPVSAQSGSRAVDAPHASDIELDGEGRLVVARGPDQPFEQWTLADVTARDVLLRAARYDGRGIVRTPEGAIGYWTTSGGFRLTVEARRAYVASGHVDCFALDGGAYRQEWGRVFVEACIPRGTSVEVGFVTSDDEPDAADIVGPSIDRVAPANVDELDVDMPPPLPPLVAAKRVTELAATWPMHRRETGSELPWVSPRGSDRFEVYEVPVPAEPGRFLWLRLVLKGTSAVAPRVRAVRVEAPGHDLLRRLPAAYRRDEAAAAFLRRYLAIADGVLTDVEARAARRDLVLDPFGAPTDMLPWLASLIGLALDERWPEHARRTMLAEAVCLFRVRGTLPGLRRMLAIYLGCDPIIVEAFRMRGAGGAFVGDDNSGIAANAVVGFGFRVGGAVAAEEATPLEGTVADAFETHAHRFSVLVPRDLDGDQLDVVHHLLDLHRPAHTLVDVCTVGRGMRVGVALHVEVSSMVGPSAGFHRAVVGGSRIGTGAVIGKPSARVRAGAARLGQETVVDP